MKKNIFRAEIVLAIIAISLLLGALFGLIARQIDKIFYPRDYSEAVTKYSEEYGVPEDLIYATIKVESNFKETAKSTAGAMGLMQMLPSTLEWLSGRLNEKVHENELFLPEVSIKYGTYYLQYLYVRFGTWELASIAYNWGEGNLSDWLKENEYTEGEYKSIPVKETRKYIEKINETREKYIDLYE